MKTGLINNLIAGGVLKTPNLIAAFKAIDRAAFVPPELSGAAYEDIPLPIGDGQTISQPWTVAFMLELLQPQPGDRVLDIGSGSGWSTALLAHAVGPGGFVLGLERIGQLVALGRNNLQKAGIKNAAIEPAGPQAGKPGERFDRILVSASADRPVPELLEQIAPGGRLVMPVNESIWLYETDRAGRVAAREYPGFRFVPLIL